MVNQPVSQFNRTPTVWVPLVLFSITLAVLLLTMAPTVYALDSAELSIGAKVLGIVHAPGYPLYLLLAHLFTNIPLNDVGFRTNLLSVVCLTLTSPLLYRLLLLLTRSKMISWVTSLCFVWSYYVWSVGLIAEVYTPQILTATAYLLATFTVLVEEYLSWRSILFSAIALGFAVAMHPTSVLLTGAIFIAFIVRHISLRKMSISAAISIIIALLPLLYFPLRYSDTLAYNLAGYYDPNGGFNPVVLNSLSGVYWMISGQQFSDLFAASNTIPSLHQVFNVIQLFWGNFLGVGIPLGILGLYELWKSRWQLAIAWLSSFLPYTYFYAGYGALDKSMMFGPSLLLWSILIAFGFAKLQTWMPQTLFQSLLLSIPIVLLTVNFPLVDLSEQGFVSDSSEITLSELPPDAYVFAHWVDITLLEYHQIVGGNRSDIRLYNLFLFESRSDIYALVNTLIDDDTNVVVVGQEAASLFRNYNLSPLPTSNSSTYSTIYLVSD